MIKRISHILYFIVTAFVVTMLFSCESHLKDVSKIDLKQFIPNSEAKDINLKHTDSGLVVAHLISPKMLDYSNLTFPYTEFPTGLHLILFEKGKKTADIYAKYGISYSDTKMIELRDSVRVVTVDYKSLATEQLFYNQSEEWFYTDVDCKYSSSQGDYSNFKGFDCNRDFSIVKAQALSGATNIKE